LKCVVVDTVEVYGSLWDEEGLSDLADSVVFQIKRIVGEVGWMLYKYAYSDMVNHIEWRRQQIKRSVLHFLRSIRNIPLVACFDPDEGVVVMNFATDYRRSPLHVTVCPTAPVQCERAKVPKDVALALAYLVDRGDRLVKDVGDARLRLQLSDVIDYIRRNYGAVAGFTVFGLQPVSAKLVYDPIDSRDWILVEPLESFPSREVVEEVFAKLGLQSVSQQLERWKVWSVDDERGRRVSLYVIDGGDIRTVKHKRAGWIALLYEYPPEHGDFSVFETHYFYHDEYYDIAKQQVLKRRDPNAVSYVTRVLSYIDNVLTTPPVGLEGGRLARFADTLGDLLERAKTRGAALGKVSLSDWEDLYVFVMDPNPSHDDIALVYVPRLGEDPTSIDKVTILTLWDAMHYKSLLHKLPQEKEQELHAKIWNKLEATGVEPEFTDFMIIMARLGFAYALTPEQ